jgi:hypothetical protein
MPHRQLLILAFIIPFALISVIANASDENVIFSENFESCIPTSWSVENGVWECCLQSPPVPPEGGNLYVGTVCGGNYPRYTDSRLISPEIDLAGIILGSDEEVILRFFNLFSYAGYDRGVVQIQVYDESTKSWSVWEDISDPIIDQSSVWSPQNIDLTAYAGQKVKIAFYHTDNGDLSTSSGWYVDNIRIACDGNSLFPHFCECDINQDRTCNILDYQLFIQDWGQTACGTPPGSGLLPNDCECDLNKNGACNILDYQRFIKDWGNSSCLVCE